MIQSAILIGLYTRQTVAWMTARWLGVIEAILVTIAALITIPSLFDREHETKLWVCGTVALEAALCWLFFCLLGRPDSRAYLNAPRKT